MSKRDATTFQRWTEQQRANRGLFNGERVQMARVSRGIARYALARKLGIPTEELKRREADWCFWTEAESALLAGFTDYPTNFFVQDDPPVFAPLFMCGHDEDGEPWCDVIGRTIKGTERKLPHV